ncbi:MAG TPA: helix-turn-helix transcriptional regulator [Candidatus Acidoferrales bacterium]|jgi:PadR family transcriptional regulator|nr:helix-turn-helix transcriptional regulator [Candidatus Acidoferrales bacterium]
MAISKIKRGSAELAILSVLAEERLYGYQVAHRIAERTLGELRFTLASLYPMLYTLERRGWIKGAWENSTSGRKRRYYRLTAAGSKQLAPLRREWEGFFRAIARLTGVAHA